MSVFKNNMAKIFSFALPYNMNFYTTRISRLSKGQSFVIQNKPIKINLQKTVLYVLSCLIFVFGSFTAFNEIKDEIEYKNSINSSSKVFSKYYEKDITACKLTQKQEGRMWCWLACLQGLLKYKNIEKSQKDIFKGVTNSWFVPLLESSRNTGLSIYSSEENMKTVGKAAKNKYSSEDSVFPYMIKDYVEKISNDKLTYQTVYINKNSNTKNIRNTIIDIYKKINKKPFSLLASHTPYCHFVNISKIDDDGLLYIEDPAYAMGRKESIDSYVKSFDPKVKKTVNSANGIFLGFVTEKENELKNASDGSYKIA